MPTNKLRKDIRALHRIKGRDRQKRCLIEGERSVMSAMGAGVRIHLLVHTDTFDSPALLEAARNTGVVCHQVGQDEMEYLSNVATPPGVIAVAGSPLVNPDLLASQDSVLILDAIQDPGNAGTLIRTASWFGVHGVLAFPGTVDLTSPKVVRASMGGIWDVSIARTDRGQDWISQWKNAGGDVVAGDLSGQRYESWVASDKTALIVGSEANGLSASVRDSVDTFVTIKGTGKGVVTESLNAAISGAILIARWQE